MIRNCSFILALVVAFSASACSQTTLSATADPSPTPKPAANRRSFEQFDLSNGGRLPSGSSTQDGYGTPTAVEQVDQGLFNTINQISESALFLEGELAKALDRNVDISARSQFSKFFVHRIEGIMMLSETHRLDLLGLGAVKSEASKKLLFQVQDSAHDIIQAVAVEAGGYTRFPKEWNGLSDKYSVPLLDADANALRLDKPALLKAMMRRMTTDLAQLKRQLVVKK